MTDALDPSVESSNESFFCFELQFDFDPTKNYLALVQHNTVQ